MTMTITVEMWYLIAIGIAVGLGMLVARILTGGNGVRDLPAPPRGMDETHLTVVGGKKHEYHVSHLAGFGLRGGYARHQWGHRSHSTGWFGRP